MASVKEMIRVLLVDDNDTDVSIVQDALRSCHAPVTITVARNLAGANTCLTESLPNLMLVSLYLSDGSGLDFLSASREESICPVMIMADSNDQDAAGAAIRAGAVDFVVKNPEGLAAISTRVERVMKERRETAETGSVVENQQQNEAHFRSIFESASAGMAIIGVNGEILQANLAFCQLLGYSAKELASLRLEDITHPQDRQKTGRLYEELLSGQRKSLDYEKRYVRKDGTIFWGHPTVAMSYAADRSFLHFVAQVQDVGERRQAEKDLLAAHQKLQSIIEFLPDATFVIDRDKNVTAWNREMEEKTGVRKEDILGQGDYAYGEALYGDRKPILIDLIGFCDLEIASQYSFFEKKGEILFAERFMPTLYGGKGAHVWLKASPLYDPEGNLVGAIESIRDITERKQAEQELRVAHRQMQDIVEFLPDATFVVDDRHEVVAWNRAMESMSGVSKEKMIGQGDHAYAVPFYGERRPILIDLIGSPDLGGKVHYDFIGERGDVKYVEQYLPDLYSGKGAYVWATASRLLDQKGNFAGAIESIRDISERKLMEEQLKEANRELDAFVHTVSHDLRSPLTPILGYAEHLKGSCRDQLDEQALCCLGEIENQGKKMLSQLEDLLALAQVGHVESLSTPVDLDEIVQEVVIGLGSRLADQGGMIERKALPELFVPRTLLFQVFDNLIGNAVQYGCCEAGPIEVAGERSGERVRFYVRDHGPGIAKKERDNIFKLFVRGNSGKKVKGTGVGLAIVQKVARRYGGSAWVEDTPGGGSTFWVEMVDSLT